LCAAALINRYGREVRSLSPGLYRRVTFWALIALVAIVITGAAVRLTGSGLGCSDWPGCTDERFVPEAELHGWVEFGNRLVTGAVSLAVIAAVLGAHRRQPRRADLIAWAWTLVAGVAAQAGLGAVTVQTHLSPVTVMAHFLLSMVLVGCAIVLHQRAGLPDDPDRRRATVPAGPSRLAVAIPALAALTLVTGTVVTGTGPHGGSEDVERFGFELPDVARVHGITAFVLAAAVGGVLVGVRRRGGDRRIERATELLLGTLLVQIGIGYVQYFNGVPALLVAFHVLGATLAWAFAVALMLAALWPPEWRQCPSSTPRSSSVPTPARTWKPTSRGSFSSGTTPSTS
jgi:cytochrome c oxidase assembly protein subunit 15